MKEGSEIGQDKGIRRMMIGLTSSGASSAGPIVSFSPTTHFTQLFPKCPDLAKYDLLLSDGLTEALLIRSKFL